MKLKDKSASYKIVFTSQRELISLNTSLFSTKPRREQNSQTGVTAISASRTRMPDVARATSCRIRRYAYFWALTYYIVFMLYS